ncbi:hypothetical protein BDD12DRAFT_810693 [Trichophaea hybrida]|nr:hypothetical protein BDD12DRAFT_810693 [Trichophaea hybrida]
MVTFTSVTYYSSIFDMLGLTTLTIWIRWIRSDREYLELARSCGFGITGRSGSGIAERWQEAVDLRLLVGVDLGSLVTVDLPLLGANPYVDLEAPRAHTKLWIWLCWEQIWLYWEQARMDKSCFNGRSGSGLGGSMQEAVCQGSPVGVDLASLVAMDLVSLGASRYGWNWPSL